MTRWISLWIQCCRSRRILYALRTSYTTAVSLIIMNYKPWGGRFTFLSGIFAPISSVMTFGELQLSYWAVLYSNLVGSFMGALSGSCYNTKALHVATLFLCLLWINRCDLWDQRAKVLGGISCLMGSLMPLLTEGHIVGFEAFVMLISLFNVPWLITGVTLIVPYPSLAVVTCGEKAVSVCKGMNKIFHALTQSFCHNEWYACVNNILSSCKFSHFLFINLPFHCTGRIFTSQKHYQLVQK